MPMTKTWTKPKLTKLSVDQTLGGSNPDFTENFVNNNGTPNDPSDDTPIGRNFS